MSTPNRGDTCEPTERDSKSGAGMSEPGKVLAFDPRRLATFAKGGLTLGELADLSKQDQYALAELGHRQLQVGDLATAERVFLGLAALDPYDAYFQVALGTIAQQRQDFDRAIRLYTRALEINPKNAVALAHRGESQLHRHNLVEAVNDLLDAVECDPDFKFESTRRAQSLALAVHRQLGEIARESVAAASSKK